VPSRAAARLGAETQTAGRAAVAACRGDVGGVFGCELAALQRRRAPSPRHGGGAPLGGPSGLQRQRGRRFFCKVSFGDALGLQPRSRRGVDLRVDGFGVNL
jgi:hypothetical protein